ncbi:hypothetical protein [Dactylosporangium matsuzakiense]|uniref:Uncharacterized protein n=1 Tax=Dactylosporangium matsuzakiense TaxID=53360 RepID=A0A9W6KE94_9ACTN|nr:hypothetical protein [Dactylosporangium matsuzakiense]UWZ45034.1 hypothetical protein Dmats_00185 [Dactylosporangium matsuzakiense]GLK99039.1 hypothetical protein GCM10017581_007800 [Dactylosporangium matsuzakiense]
MAESKPSQPAVSRCAKWTVRGLIVAGVAGVAWLMSAAAAHASGTEISDQPALLAPVTNLLIGDSGARHTGMSGDQPRVFQHRPDRQPPALDRRRGDLLTSTVFTVLSPVAKAAAPVTGTVTGAVTGTVHRTVTLTKAPVQTVDRHRSASADASSAKHASKKRPAQAGITRTHHHRTQEPAVQAVPVRAGSSGDVTAAATGTTRAGVDTVAAARAAARLRALRVAEALDGASARPVVNRNIAQGANHVPLLPRPAPMPAPPAAGLATGVPSSGSGLNHEGAAVLPAAPAGTKVLTFRPDAVEDVELRLLAAEKPTVSPD